MKDLRQTKEYVKQMKSIGWKVERLNNNYYFVRKFPIIGSFIKIQRPEKINFTDIDKVVKKHRAFQIIIEPKHQYRVSRIAYGRFKLSNSPYLPSKTLHLDLTKSKKSLHKNLKKDCRYALRKTEKLEIKGVKNIEKFRYAWRNAVGFKRYISSLNDLKNLKKSFGKKCIFLMINDGSAGSIFLMGDKTAYYWQAFTNKDGRKALAQYKLVWEGILWAKKNKSKIFDFEGIYDERFPNKKWLGFTHFKKSFGGRIVNYPGAFVKYKLPF